MSSLNLSWSTKIKLLKFKLYTLLFKSLASVRFFMFFKEVSYAHQGCIYLMKNKNGEMLLKFKNTLKCNLFLWRKAEFSASLLQSSVSHDTSEIILICWFIISVETVVLLHIFWDLWYFFQDFLINQKLKRTVFIQNRNFVLQYSLLFKSLGSVFFFLRVSIVNVLQPPRNP